MFNECRHIMPSGVRCHAAALRDMPYCYFHTSSHRSSNPKNHSPMESVKIPLLEDSSTVQIALAEVLGALGSARLDPRRAGLFLYGLQIAAQITARRPAHKPSETVRSLSDEGDGDVLAPEKTTCEPPDDCPNCPRRNDCDTCDIYFEDEDEDED